MADGNQGYFDKPPSLVTVGEDGEETLHPIPQDTAGSPLALTATDGVLEWSLGIAGGHYSIMCDGDPDDPQPVYAVNESGDMDFLEFWVED